MNCLNTRLTITERCFHCIVKNKVGCPNNLEVPGRTEAFHTRAGERVAQHGVRGARPHLEVRVRGYNIKPD